MSTYILGICGTFMGGIALLGRELGLDIAGSDAQVYPPMSEQLVAAGIQLYASDDLQSLSSAHEVVIGNALKRGHPAVEAILNQNIPYTSGPAWLTQHILHKRKVIAIAGTHGKTTTASLMAWILEFAGEKPGFLIGGVPQNFGVSARLGQGEYFVVEADEYDTAFFDKRSKFIHYHPQYLILNNLEFDHADIFPDVNAIKQQFHYLLRTVPGNGLIVWNEADHHLREVMMQGCWTPTLPFSLHETLGWQAKIEQKTNHFAVLHQQREITHIPWSHTGIHNVCNALAAFTLCAHLGIAPATIREALLQFTGVKRRLEILAQINGITIYDDFAHHPTALRSTLQGLKNKITQGRIIALVEFASNTMRAGKHGNEAFDALSTADEIHIFGASPTDKKSHSHMHFHNDVERIITHVLNTAKNNDHVVIMSNKNFAGLREKLVNALQQYNQ